MTELPDRLLRDALDATASKTTSAACVTVDGLAAWADGTMTRADRAAFEAHAAGCARCLALLAAMARTEPPPIERAWWRRSPFAWLLPLATVAAAAVIVVDLVVVDRQSSPAVTLVRQQQEAASRPLPAPSPAAPAVVPPSLNANADARPAADARSSASAPPVAAPSRAARRQESPAIDRPSLAATRAKAETSVPVTPSQPASTVERAPKEVGAAQPAPAGAPASAAAQPPAPAPAPPAAAAAAVVPASARNDTARDASLRAAGAPLAMKSAALMPIVILSPDRDSQWRILAGAVEHSADRGQTWQPQSLGVATPMRAGAAPAARVCWLVGTGGVVLRTIDGATWTRIPFPDAADLLAVQAADAAHATVTTAAGRRLTTSDGGATWSTLLHDL